MNKIHNFLSKFLVFVPKHIQDAVGVDKVLHFLAGFILAILMLVLHLVFPYISLSLVMIVPTVVGILKEVMDFIMNKVDLHNGLQETHSVDILDIMATICGSLPVAACVLVLL